MRPSFDHTEEYLIAYYRNMRARKWDAQSFSDIAYLVVACFGLAWGLYKDDAVWIIVGFLVISFRLIQLSVSSGRYNPVLANIIKKYEQACTEVEVPVKSKPPQDVSDDQ